MRWLRPLIAVVLFAMLTMVVAAHVRRVPVQSLDYVLAFLRSDEMFLLEENRPTPCGTQRLKEWLDYFIKVVRLLPNLSEAHGMMGFCYGELHQNDQAIAALNRAIVLNPHFWGFHYNVGVIYLRQNNLAQAKEHFAKALETTPKINALFMYASKIYADLVRKSHHKDIDFAKRLQEGYQLSLVGSKLASPANLPLRMF